MCVKAPGQFPGNKIDHRCVVIKVALPVVLVVIPDPTGCGLTGTKLHPHLIQSARLDITSIAGEDDGATLAVHLGASVASDENVVGDAHVVAGGVLTEGIEPIILAGRKERVILVGLNIL